MFPFYPAPGKNPQTEYYAPIIYSDSVLFHVTLQLSAIHLEKAHDKSDVRQSKRLMGECIRLLRQRIESSDSGVAVSDETISAVAGLAAIEHEKGNIRMVQMHMQGLKRMADLRGGLNGLRRSNAMVANIVFCMFIAAIDEPFPHIDLVSGIEYPDWYYQAAPRFEYNPEFVNFEDYGVDPEFAACLQNIRVLAFTYQTANDCETTELYLSVLTFLCATCQRIMSLPPVPEYGSPRYFLAEAVRSTTALHVFSQWCGHQPDPALMVSKAQHDLKEALRPLMISGAGNPVLLWIVAAGGVGAFGSPERTWFVGHLAAMVQEMGISSWEEMKGILKTVIWHEHQDDPTHKALWDEIVERIENLES